LEHIKIAYQSPAIAVARVSKQRDTGILIRLSMINTAVKIVDRFIEERKIF